MVVLLLAAATFAHEYWFEPDNFFLSKGQVTRLHLFVGEALKMDEEREYQPAKTNSFQLFSPTGPFDMRTMADAEKKPLLNFSSASAGTYLFSMERNWSYISLDADKFEAYLHDEGMDYVITERRRLGESKKEGRERYSRYLKSMIQVGDGVTGNVKTRLGSKLEIVPLDNPYGKRVSGTLSFQIWFDGRPLVEKAVFADNRDGDVIDTRELKTDKEGKVEVKFGRKGIWLIRVVHMQRCENRCGEADWESFWGALSFGVK